MATPLTLGITSDVGAVANFLTECGKVGLDLVELYDQPDVKAAREQQIEQKQRERDAEAVTEAKAGDSTSLEERSS